jgi:putative nucleotidyltransferase-like protein
VKAETHVNASGGSREWEILLECASAPPDAARLQLLLQDARWDHLLELAEGHGVFNLLAQRIRERGDSAVPAAFRSRLLELQRMQALSNLGLIAEMIRVLEQFEAGGIQPLVLKGPALSLQAYGDAAARQYGDIDILVRHRDILPATREMLALGFQARVAPEIVAAGKVPGEYFFSRPNTKVIIEVHTERTLRYFPNQLSVEELFMRSARLDLNGRAVPTLSAEDALVSMCTHGAKHFWERLMWVADLAAMVAGHPDLDWSLAGAIAEKLGAQRILHTGLLLAQDLLRARLPELVLRQARADAGAVTLVGKVNTWLPQGDGASIGLLGRALFRAQMRHGFWAGLAYVARLSLSPTEDDWREGQVHKHSRYRDVMRRLFRLVGKYGRNSDH